MPDAGCSAVTWLLDEDVCRTWTPAPWIDPVPAGQKEGVKL